MTICVPWFGCMTILVEMHLLCDYSGNLPSIPTACDPIRAAGCASFQSGRHHRYSLVDSTPTTKEETFIMPPCSSSAGFSGVWAGCSGLSPSCGCIRTCTLGLRWCHVFSKHYCPPARFMVKVWSFLCMLSSWPDCRIAPCGALSAPVDVCAELMWAFSW